MKYLALLICLMISACSTTKPMAQAPTMPAPLLPMFPALFDAPKPATKTPTIDCPILGPCVAHYVFDQDVDEDSVGAAKAWLAKVKTTKARYIVMTIDTNGGSVPDGMELVQAMEDVGVPITCVVDTKALSMGLAILGACDNRMMTKRSRLMAHEPATGGLIGGQQQTFENIRDDLRTTNRALAEHIAAKWKISVESYLDRIAGGRTWWLDWVEAEKIGAVDNVVPSARYVLEELRAGRTP